MAQINNESKRADAVTRLIAKRVAEVRRLSGMNQGELGDRMAKLRPMWSRSTVVKLENHNRESLSVTDLFALAVVLGVPPAWLLVDPSGSAPTVVAEGVERGPWEALLWVDGQQALEDPPPSREWDVASRAIGQVHRVEALVAQLAQAHFYHESNAALTPDEHDPAEQDEAERRILRALRGPLKDLVDRGYALPPLPALVRTRAAELGVGLPGIGE